MAELLQTVRELKLGTIHPEEHIEEVGGPLPASSMNASAMVEAAKTGLEYRPREDGQSWVLIKKERRLVVNLIPAAAEHPALKELTMLLNLQPGRQHYEIVVAPGIVLDPALFPCPPRGEVELSTRSNAQVFFFLANGVEVPPEHLAGGVAIAAAGTGWRAVRQSGRDRRPVHGPRLCGA